MASDDSKATNVLRLLHRERAILLKMAARLVAKEHNMPIDADLLSHAVGQQAVREILDEAVVEGKRQVADVLDEHYQREIDAITGGLGGQPEHLIAMKVSEARQRFMANRARLIENTDRCLRERAETAADALAVPTVALPEPES